MQEIKTIKRRELLMEHAEKLMHSSASEQQPISFYEGVAMYLAQSFLDSRPVEQPPYGYLTHRAA